MNRFQVETDRNLFQKPSTKSPKSSFSIHVISPIQHWKFPYSAFIRVHIDTNKTKTEN